VAFAGENYLLLARFHNEKMTAVEISIIQAAVEQPHFMSANSATESLTGQVRCVQKIPRVKKIVRELKQLLVLAEGGPRTMNLLEEHPRFA